MAPIKSQHQAQRSASEVKAHWRDIVEEAKTVGEVVVTNHNRPEVIVLSLERYAKLKREAHDPLAEMRAEWDRRLAVLNEPGADEKLRKFMDSTPAEIAAAANAAARREKR
jgi:prevent-host-death family protein